MHAQVGSDGHDSFQSQRSPCGDIMLVGNVRQIKGARVVTSCWLAMSDRSEHAWQLLFILTNKLDEVTTCGLQLS